MSTTERGRTAEAAAAEYLVARGYDIVDRNWRNRWCELDLVARSEAGVHIIEVKYRRRTDWGDGFAAITADKIQRLRRAAAAWCQAHHYDGSYQIDIISVTGELSAPTIEYLPNSIEDF
jgi:putative endonuclease